MDADKAEKIDLLRKSLETLTTNFGFPMYIASDLDIPELKKAIGALCSEVIMTIDTEIMPLIDSIE